MALSDDIAKGIARMNLTHEELLFMVGFLSNRVPEDISDALKAVLAKRQRNE